MRRSLEDVIMRVYTHQSMDDIDMDDLILTDKAQLVFAKYFKHSDSMVYQNLLAYIGPCLRDNPSSMWMESYIQQLLFLLLDVDMSAYDPYHNEQGVEWASLIRDFDKGSPVFNVLFTEIAFTPVLQQAFKDCGQLFSAKRFVDLFKIMYQDYDAFRNYPVIKHYMALIDIEESKPISVSYLTDSLIDDMKLLNQFNQLKPVFSISNIKSIPRYVSKEFDHNIISILIDRSDEETKYDDAFSEVFETLRDIDVAYGVPQSDNQYVLYVYMSQPSGFIKVGRTKHWHSRMRLYEKPSFKDGFEDDTHIRLLWWTYLPMYEADRHEAVYRASEKVLKELCYQYVSDEKALIQKPHGYEWFQYQDGFDLNDFLVFVSSGVDQFLARIDGNVTEDTTKIDLLKHSHNSY